VNETGPAAPGGICKVIFVGPVTLTVESGCRPPNTTEVVPVRLVPLTVTTPPVRLPTAGTTDVMVGFVRNVNDVVASTVPPIPLTTTDTVPAAWDLVLADIDVSPLTVYVAADVPANLTAVAPVKPVPLIATVVPPPTGPSDGVSDVMVGLPR
jgi:hypothetical protein